MVAMYVVAGVSGADVANTKMDDPYTLPVRKVDPLCTVNADVFTVEGFKGLLNVAVA